jgi:protein SCO1/2
VAAALVAASAPAHDGVAHATPEEAARHRAETGGPPVLADPAPSGPVTALPFDLGGPYELVDQEGRVRTQADPEGRLQLLFFGYANCPSICAVAMPMMAQVVDALADGGVAATPVMITVDPERDTVETMGAPLAEIHPDFVGLTGDGAALVAAYEAFGIERTLVAELPDYGPVYAHGGHVFLLDGAGDTLTILPPILSVEAMTAVAMRYAETR